jgi:hypothetical protein
VIIPRMPNCPARREVGFENRKLLISKLVVSHHDAASFAQDFWSIRGRCQTTKPDCRTEPNNGLLDPCVAITLLAL